MHLNGNDFRFWTDLIFWQKFDLAQRPISPWGPWRRYRHGAFCCVGHQKKAPPHVSYKAKCPFGTTAVLQVQTACLAHALHGHVIIWIPMARNSILKKSHVLFWTASILFSVWISALKCSHDVWRFGPDVTFQCTYLHGTWKWSALTMFTRVSWSYNKCTSNWIKCTYPIHISALNGESSLVW